MAVLLSDTELTERVVALMSLYGHTPTPSAHLALCSKCHAVGDWVRPTTRYIEPAVWLHIPMECGTNHSTKHVFRLEASSDDLG